MNSHMDTSDSGVTHPESRADELSDLLKAVGDLVIPFVQAADTSRLPSHDPGSSSSPPSSSDGISQPHPARQDLPPERHDRLTLVDERSPSQLKEVMHLDLPAEGAGKDGLVESVKEVLSWSVNTWDQGFMDKLYASTNPVGVVSDLLLSVLNTNVHVYQVSPALTLIEKQVTVSLARLYGFTSPNAGGVAQPGGSAGNASSIVIARNTLHPETKEHGNGSKRFTLFTSQHGHYSLEKAAQMFGLGSSSVISVPVDEEGRMIPSELEHLVLESKGKGETPFYVNSTAGTTVLGSFDPFEEIADVCEKHGLWCHVDGSWGGSVVFNQAIARVRLKGVERADSVVMSPHKMLGVPTTCSFLLGKDMRVFWKAMTLPAGYLFHNDQLASSSEFDIYDLADLTPQCGRRGDALKMYLAWKYYGASGFSSRIKGAYDRAHKLYGLLEASGDFEMVSTRPLPCLQVCFYYVPGCGAGKRGAAGTGMGMGMGNGAIGTESRGVGKTDGGMGLNGSGPTGDGGSTPHTDAGGADDVPGTGSGRKSRKSSGLGKEQMSNRTEQIVRRLVPRGFMVDYAPGPRGKFFRVVVNGETTDGTVERLVRLLSEVGRQVVDQERAENS